MRWIACSHLGTNNSNQRPCFGRSTEETRLMMTFVGMPRALVTLRHTPDRRSVEAALQRIGYTVRATDDHAVSEVLLHSFRPLLMISDAIDLFPVVSALMLQVRRCNEIYVIVIGANTHTERITILRHGADEALPTGVAPEEVAVRCQVLMRRSREFLHPTLSLNEATHLYFGPLIIDLARREMTVNHFPIASTRLEFELFVQLCRRPLEVCSRNELVKTVWGPTWVGDTHIVDVHLSNLRRKLNERAPELRFMHTVRGIGFRLTDDLLQLAVHDLASSRTLQMQNRSLGVLSS